MHSQYGDTCLKLYIHERDSLIVIQVLTNFTFCAFDGMSDSQTCELDCMLILILLGSRWDPNN